MNRRQVIGGMGTLATSFLMVGCSPPKIDEVRYRIAVEFDTPDGVKSASNVIKVTRQHPSSYSPIQRWGWKTEGEAVFVDLRAGKNAIMLLAGGGTELVTLWGRAYGLTNGESYDAWNGKHRDRIKGIAELERELVLTIVTFTDINDPASAKVLRAQADYMQSFGAGYGFRRATLEVVPNSTPVTRGIEGKLPWWNGPFPWLKQSSPGSMIYVDTRTDDQFRWNKEQFRRNF
jgi:hypothetical protein